MELVPGFVLLKQGLSATMTASTFTSLSTVLTGWIFARRQTVTRMILAADSVAEKYCSSHHRLFSAARWSLDALGLAVFDLIQPFLRIAVLPGLDDTLFRKRGLKMFGTGVHHNPQLSSRGKVITNWGHSCVVLEVIVELPFRRGHCYCLPILFRMYLSKKSALKHRRVYRARPELLVELLELLWNCRNSRHFRDRRQRLRWPERTLSLAHQLRSHESTGERRSAVRGPIRTPTGHEGPVSRARRATADVPGDARGPLSPRELEHLWTGRTRASGRRWQCCCIPWSCCGSRGKVIAVGVPSPALGTHPKQPRPAPTCSTRSIRSACASKT